MSYEIIYDKQFVKVKDNLFLPMVLSGSNNCTEFSFMGRERRARGWYPLNVGDGMFLTKEEMLAHCEEERERVRKSYEGSKFGAYTDNCFGNWSGLAIGNTRNKVTYGMYKGIFTTGCRKALTVEQLAAVGIGVEINSYSYKDEYKGLEEKYCVVTTSDELFRVYNEYKEYYKGSGVSVHIGFGYEAERRVPKARKLYFPIKKHTGELITNDDDYWTIKFIGESEKYLAKKRKHGYQYAYYPYLKYLNKKDALKRMNPLIKKGMELELEFVKAKVLS